VCEKEEMNEEEKNGGEEKFEDVVYNKWKDRH